MKLRSQLLFALAVVLMIAMSSVFAQVANPAVTQANIKHTICTAGWAEAQRPPVSYTNKIKFKLMAEAGVPREMAGDFELDHKESIEDGGHPSDPRNLVLQLWVPSAAGRTWPDLGEPHSADVECKNGECYWIGFDRAHEKDVVETRMKRLVCAGRVPLATARACLAKDWRTCPRS